MSVFYPWPPRVHFHVTFPNWQPCQYFLWIFPHIQANTHLHCNRFLSTQICYACFCILLFFHFIIHLGNLSTSIGMKSPHSLFTASQYSLVLRYRLVFNQFPIGGHLGCCQVLAIATNTAVNNQFLLSSRSCSPSGGAPTGTCNSGTERHFSPPYQCCALIHSDFY